jgi:hypothetical protein
MGSLNSRMGVSSLTIRKELVELFDLDVLSKLTLLRLREIEVKLVGVDGAPDRTVVFGYVSPSGPDFI